MMGLAPRPVSVVIAVALMGLVIIVGLVSIFTNADFNFGDFDLMDLLHLCRVGFFILILAPLAVLVWRRRNLARLIYVAVSVFGVSADVGGISGAGRVELGRFIGSL